MAFDWSAAGRSFAKSSGNSSSDSSGDGYSGGSKWEKLGASYAKSSAGYEEEKKKRDQEEKLKRQKADAVKQSQQNANDILGNIGKFVGGVAEGIAAPFKRVGEGTAEVINELTGGAQRERDVQAAAQQQTVDLIKSLGQKMRSAKTDEEKNRYREAIKRISKIDDEQYKRFQERQSQIVERTDPIKGAAAVGELGLNVLTGGTVGAVARGAGTLAKTTNVAQKLLTPTGVKQGIVSGAIQGASYGALGTAEQQGGKATVGDYAKNVAAGAALGGVAGGVVPALGKGLPTITSTKLGQKAAETKVGQKITNLKDNFVAKVVDDTNMIKKQFKGAVNPSTGQKITDEIEGLVTNVRQFAALSQSRLENNQAFQSLKPLISGDKKRYEDFGRFINEKQQAINLQKVGRGEGVTVPTGTPEQEKAYQLLNQATKDDIQYLFDNGKITQEQYDKWINDPDYTRVQKEVLDDQGRQYGKSGLVSGSSVTQQKLKGSNKKSVDPFAAYEDWSRQVTLEVEKNTLAKYLRDQMLERGITKPIRVADKVIERTHLYGEAAQLRPLRNRLARLVKTQGKYVNTIERELNALNEEGLNLALSKQAPAALEQPTKVLTVKKVAPLIKDKAPKVLDDIKTSNNVKAKLVKEYGSGVDGVKNMALDIHYGGYSKLQKLTGITKASARSIAEQILKKPTTRAGKTILSENTVGRRPTVQQAVDRLLNSDPAQLKVVRKKIANREPKLAQAIDEINAIKDEYDTVRTEVSNLVKRARQLSDIDPRGENTLKVFENGVRELYTIDPAAAKQLSGVADLELKAIADWALLPSRILRGGATSLNPAFAIPNFIKDQVSSAVLSKNALATHNPISFIAGIKEAIAKPTLKATVGRIPGAKEVAGKLWEPSETYKLWASRNANITRADLSRNLKQATRQSLEDLGVKNESFLRKYENVISASEKATRYQNFLGTYKNALKKGKSPEVAIDMANQAARENSINFTRRGEISTFMKIFNPYFNASIQGSARLARSFKERPVGTSLKIGATILTPVAASTYYNLSDPDRAAVYANISDAERKGNLIMVLGSGRGYIKVPLPAGMKEFANPVRDFIESEYLGDRQSLLETAKNIFVDAFSPVGTTGSEVLSNLTPQAIKPLVELSMNKNLYSGKEVVPENLKGSAPEDQVFDSTPQVYRDIAKVFGISPLQVQKVVQGYTASAGEGALVSADLARGAETGGRSTPEQLASRFFQPEVQGQGRVSSKFYESYNPLKAQKENITQKITTAVKDGDLDKANELARNINSRIDAEKEKLNTTYGKFEVDLTDLFDRLDSLKIPMDGESLSARSIQSRKKQ